MKYFSKERKRISFMKNFEEDTEKDYDAIEAPYKTLRYSKKLRCRQQIQTITAEQFRKDLEHQEEDIWELRYISSSCDEDNDTEEDESEEGDDGEESEEEESSDEEEEAKLTEEEKAARA